MLVPSAFCCGATWNQLQGPENDQRGLWSVWTGTGSSDDAVLSIINDAGLSGQRRQKELSDPKGEYVNKWLIERAKGGQKWAEFSRDGEEAIDEQASEHFRQ